MGRLAVIGLARTSCSPTSPCPGAMKTMRATASEVPSVLLRNPPLAPGPHPNPGVTKTMRPTASEIPPVLLRKQPLAPDPPP